MFSVKMSFESAPAQESALSPNKEIIVLKKDGEGVNLLHLSGEPPRENSPAWTVRRGKQ